MKTAPLRTNREIRTAERWLLWVAAVERLLVDLEHASRNLRTIQRRWSVLREEARSLRRSSRPRAVRHSAMTVREAAAALDVSEAHLRRLLRRGDLIGVRFERPVEWRLSRRYVRHLAQHRAATGRWPSAEAGPSLGGRPRGPRRGATNGAARA